MELHPIVAALRRHRLAVALLVLEIALCCAILCNLAFMIFARLSSMQVPSGIAESELTSLTIGSFRGDNQGAAADAIVQQQLAALRAIPGVRSADAINSLPLDRNSWYTEITFTPDAKDPVALICEFLATTNAVSTLGLKLVEGRAFTEADAAPMDSFLPTAPVAILPLALAHKLWPGEDALGKTFYMGAHRYQVVGVVEHLLAPVVHDPAQADFTALFPVAAASDTGGSYVLRAATADRDRVLREAEDVLLKISPTGIISDRRHYSEVRAQYFRQDRAMAGLLAGSCLLLLLVTALGIVGLASFWVQSRTRSIGVRRALGARRGDILRYFQAENFLIVGVGIGLGMACAYGLNLWLIERYEIGRLPLLYLPVGALSLWALGQAATLGPALRAARVPPVIATRSV
jgi:putative ABC transport system permease protein